ncbi:hypothetical protein [Streptomyces mayteni]
MTPGVDDWPPEVTWRLLVGLRASLQCWSCGEGTRRVRHAGELVGPLGPVPLYLCEDCGRRQERLYRRAIGREAADQAKFNPEDLR